MSSHHFEQFFFAVGFLLLAAHFFGALAVKTRQPAVVGELLGGILLGPTALAHIFPEFQSHWLSLKSEGGLGLQYFTQISICLFLFVAGMEFDLVRVLKQRKQAAWVSIGGLVIPFALGFGVCLLHPQFFGLEPGTSPLTLALFIGTALSITALPVIARILKDMKLLSTDFGVLIMTSAVINDLTGWIVFALILAINKSIGGSALDICMSALITLSFVVLALTVVRKLVNQILCWLSKHDESLKLIFGLAAGLALLGASAASGLGIHANFGAFVMGIAVGDSPYLPQRVRQALDDFISFVLAPVFFASVGLTTDFVQHFNAPLVIAIFIMASISKILGSSLGAWIGGFGREYSLAIGMAMNARGAVEIVLALLALQAGIIGTELFVALIFMAIATSMLSGVGIRYFLGSRSAEILNSGTAHARS